MNHSSAQRRKTAVIATAFASAAIAVGAGPSAALAVDSGMALGANHTCAIDTAADVWCWGSNSSGQLGNRSNSDSTTPVQVKNLDPSVAVVAGRDHTCALGADGYVRCWGANGRGQLGDGSWMNQLRPVRVIGVARATALAAGDRFNCALIADGTVTCWGDGDMGQLGVANPSGWKATGVKISNLKRVTKIAAGGSFACAITADQTVSCWGDGSAHQLGSDMSQSATPVKIPGIQGATALSLGGAFACAQAAGAWSCWGDNSTGALGVGNDSEAVGPQGVTAVSGQTQFSAGGSHACALFATRAVRCWGQAANGQLGNGQTGVTSSRNETYTDYYYNHTNRSSYPWTCEGRGYGYWGFSCEATRTVTDTIEHITNAVAVTGISSATSIATGFNHSCAIVASGTIRCWGENGGGQIGNGSTDDALTPKIVSGLNLSRPAAPRVSAKPQPSTTSVSASISFSGDSGATFQCSYYGGTFTACSSPVRFSNLGLGAHTLSIRQVIGGITGSPATVRWTVTR